MTDGRAFTYRGRPSRLANGFGGKGQVNRGRFVDCFWRPGDQEAKEVKRVMYNPKLGRSPKKGAARRFDPSSWRACHPHIGTEGLQSGFSTGPGNWGSLLNLIRQSFSIGIAGHTKCWGLKKRYPVPHSVSSCLPPPQSRMKGDEGIHHPQA